MLRWTYSVRPTNRGIFITDYYEIDVAELPQGVPHFATRHQAKLDRKRRKNNLNLPKIELNEFAELVNS